jgi:BolA family transcriptional regulator, general stress-responsive regulator
MAGRAARIEAALRGAFAPTALEIVDESARHAGHAGARPEGETHYAVRIEAPAFAGMGRVERSRAVHAVLAEEFAQGLHALSLRVRGPGEAG